MSKSAGHNPPDLRHEVGLQDGEFADSGPDHAQTDNFDSLFEFLPIGAYRSSAEGKQLRANPAQVRLNGYASEAEMLEGVKDIGQEWYALPGRRAQFWELLERDGFVKSFESEIYRHKTRERIWIVENAHLVRGSDGKIRYCEGTTEEITERVLAQAALRQSEQELRQIIDLVPQYIFAKDAQGRTLLANQAFAKAMGLPLNEIIGRRFERFNDEPLQVRLYGMTDRQAIESGASLHNPEYEVFDAKGQRHLLRTSKIVLLIGGAAALLSVSVDITELRQAQEDLGKANLRMGAVIESCPLPVYTRDLEGLVTTWNPAAEQVFGWSAAEALGRPLLSLAPDQAAESADMRARVLSGETMATSDVRRTRKDGALIDLTSSMAPLRDGAGAVYGYLTISRDVTEKKRSESLIWQQANFDALTGLPNRRMLRDRMAQGMLGSRRESLSLAVLFIDLDHFKEINDTQGHAQGDVLLVEAARRIRACVRESDTVARLGGDEFTVLLTEVRDTTRVEEIGQSIVTALAKGFKLGPETSFVTASIGVALYPEDAGEIDDLFKHADQAMYVAKAAGRNCLRYFTPALQAQAQTRMRLASDLRGAVAGGQLRVHYQPLVDLASGAVCKAEALVRWVHPTLGWVGPAEFIPVAESTGLIGEIGDWVFEQVAEQVKRWRLTLDPAFQISLNRSPMQFHKSAGALEPWLERLRQLGLPGDCISIEITEGLLLNNRGEVRQQLEQFRAAGMGLSLDDFGTGYSSLSYLQSFDLDALKIDRSFVANMLDGVKDRALCDAVIGMAQALGLKVVAEGIETKLQRDWLIASGCDYGQGYLFARPMPANEFEAWMASHPRLI